MQISEWIRQNRLRLGLTQAQFARNLNLAQETQVSTWETGKKMPRFETLQAMAALFKVPLPAQGNKKEVQ